MARGRSTEKSGPASTSAGARLLELAADPELAAETERLVWFRRFVLLYGAARSWLWLPVVPFGAATVAATAVLLSVACLLAFLPRWAHIAARLALVALGLQLWLFFPQPANHFYLEVLCVALLCIPGRSDPAGEGLTLQGLRWLTAIVLFHTGLQKLLYGLYFRGEFLALMVGNQERFARLFQLVLSADELARLTAYDPRMTGAGPYRATSSLFLVASNLTYLAELVLPFLLIPLRSRRLGGVLAVAFIVAIQLGALELGFAFLFLNLLFLFLPGPWNRRLLPLFAAVMLYSLGAAFGILPGEARGWYLY